MTVKNATTFPKIYYGLHFCPGVAEYKDPGAPAYRIFINEDTIRKMNATFAGRPVYVQHVDEVDLTKIQEQADGYVVESFFNAADGKTWAKFIVVSDKGHEAIRNGWRLSNAYVPKQMAGGGLWNGVEYVKEVMNGEYEHLAIVQNPRYEESIILSPEDFKLYNSEKELALKKLSNAKGETSMFKFFKKQTVENAADLETMSVVLPKSKEEKTLSQIINEMDEYTLQMKEPQMANGDHHVMVGDEKMTVNELVAKHMEMKKSAADKGAPPAEEKPDPQMNAEDEAKKKADKEAADKKANEEASAEKDEEKKKNAAHFDALKNAQDHAIGQGQVVELSMDKVARGKARYGSGQ